MPSAPGAHQGGPRTSPSGWQAPGPSPSSPLLRRLRIRGYSGRGDAATPARARCRVACPPMAASDLTARQRTEFRVARRLGLLPPRVQVRLSGRPPVRVDGQQLEPDIQLTLALLERQGAPPFEELPL